LDEKPIKEFRDPIHGFIPIYGKEFDIIQDPVFQRLRRIKQLSFGYLVYHGAEHSRFGHVIGVMHLVEKALKKIQENAKKLGTEINLNENDIRLARFSALLHDVGHHPFSHALDYAGIIPKKHEYYSTMLVEKHFAKYFTDLNIKPEHVNNLILGNPPPDKPYLGDLIHSQIDMDRCDYLLRDSHYAGVKYGIYDLDRLLDSLFVTDEGQLVILNKGFFSAEQFVLARYHMFNQIYLHKTKRCFENLAKKCCQYLFENGEFNYPTTDDLGSEKGIQDFIEKDDAWLLNKINSISEPRLENVVNSLKLRDPFTRVIDSEIISLKIAKSGLGKDGSIFVKTIEDDLKYGLIKTDQLEKMGIEKEDIIFDEATQLSYQLRPYASIIPGEKKPEDPHTIFIYDEENKEKITMEEKSNLIQVLGEAVKIRRIYVLREKKETLMAYLKGKYPTLN